MVSILPLPILHITQSSHYSQFLGRKDSSFLTIWIGCETLAQRNVLGRGKQGTPDVVKSLMACKTKPGASICAFVLEMKGYFDRLESLNMVFDAELSINIILFGLPADYNQFVLSYQMNRKETSIMEIHSLLQTAKQGIKKIDVPSTSAALVLTVGHNAKKRKTFHSSSKGKAAKRKSDRGSKRKGLKESRRLKHGELNLVMGNQKITPVTRIVKYKLMLKSRVRIDLNNSFPCKGIYETIECIGHNGNVILNIGSSNELDKSKLWHSRLGHVNKKCIAQLQKDGVLESFNFKSDDVCESCLLGKMTKSPFTGLCEIGEGLLDLVHTDMCGPFGSATKDGKHYYVMFTDDFSRYGYVYLIKHKSDTFEVFKRYQNEVENQLGRKIKVLQSDKGGEYLSIEFFDHFKNCGIVSQLTPPRTPQLNRVAERRNRTMLDMGCEVFIRQEAQDKLEARSKKCLFIGYLEESFGYLFYKPKDNVVFVAQRGVFLEREMISKEDSGSKIDLEEIQESADEEPIVNTNTQPEVVTPVKPDDISLPIRRTSGRVSKPPQFYYGFHNVEENISDSTLSELDKPANYKEAMASSEAAKWKEAMKSKIQSMYDNQVWNLVDTTPGLKAVGCKWIFKKKTDMDRKVHMYKARLVAKGYTQTHGIDYEETFSLVAKIKSIRIMLAIVAFHDYEIWQMDVKTVFLNVKLTEDVFMAQLEGFENAKYPKRVCKLQKVIYGLKQASRNNVPTLQSVKDWLRKCFTMKDLGDAAYILGIKIYKDRSKHLIGLSQDTYLDKFLKRFKMEKSKKGNLPLRYGIKISKDLYPKTDEELHKMSRVTYASAVGSIMYAMTCTRPNVSFALSMVSRHQQNPGEGHLTTIKNILKYLRNTKDRFLVYGEEELILTSYCDTSWQTDKDDIHSQSGWIFLLNEEAMTWKSLKQDTVADSTLQDPIEIFYDNESAVALTKEPKDH
ncbi:putative RNA-directed DNA polymerase [Tanacetum coccineum]